MMGTAQDEIEGRDKGSNPMRMPHGEPREALKRVDKEMIDTEKTPGAGALVDEDAKGGDADVGSE